MSVLDTSAPNAQPALRIGHLDNPWLVEVKYAVTDTEKLKNGQELCPVQIGRDAVIIGPDASWRLIAKCVVDRLRGRMQFR